MTVATYYSLHSQLQLFMVLPKGKQSKYLHILPDLIFYKNTP